MKSRSNPKNIYRTDETGCCSGSTATRWTFRLALAAMVGLSYLFVLPSLQHQTLRSLLVNPTDKIFIRTAQKATDTDSDPALKLWMSNEIENISNDDTTTDNIAPKDSDENTSSQSTEKIPTESIHDEDEVGSTGSTEVAVNSSSSQLAFVPIRPFQACNSKFESVSCKSTILFGKDGNIPLPNITDLLQQTQVCKQIHSDDSKIAKVPVCVQNADVVGVLINLPDSPDDTTLKIVDSINDESLKNFVTKDLLNVARIVELKRVDFPGVYKGIDDTDNKVWERFRDDNYGNMVWRYASSMIMNQVTTEVDSSDRYSQPELRDGPVDAFVIATANTLHLTAEPLLRDLVETITERVKQRNLPTIIIGMGIQIDFGKEEQDYNLASTDLALTHPFQREFLEQVSLHQTVPSIGVRGDMTKAVCENSGIHNCVSMGCPSLTISRDVNLGKTLETNWLNVLEKLKAKEKDIKIALTCPAGVAKAVDIAHGVIANILEQYGDHVTIIKQAPNDITNVEKFLETKWNKIKPTSRLTSSNLKYEEYVNVESWLAGAKKYDLCISFRIHGSMTFIASGVPTIAAPTDFRIMELLAAMKIPYQLPHDLETLLLADLSEQQTNPNEESNFVLSIMNQAKNRNFTNFEINRREKLKGWRYILEKAGLEMDPALLRVITSPL